jgi:hypothetical protein
MKVTLVRKYAERIDGVDLSDHEVGDSLDLPAFDANLLLAEGWAVPERRHRTKRTAGAAELEFAKTAP